MTERLDTALEAAGSIAFVFAPFVICGVLAVALAMTPHFREFIRWLVDGDHPQGRNSPNRRARTSAGTNRLAAPGTTLAGQSAPLQYRTGQRYAPRCSKHTD